MYEITIKKTDEEQSKEKGYEVRDEIFSYRVEYLNVPQFIMDLLGTSEEQPVQEFCVPSLL